MNTNPGCEKAGCKVTQASDCSIVGLVNTRLCEGCLRALMQYQLLEKHLNEIRRGKMLLDAQHKLLRSGNDIMARVEKTIDTILRDEEQVRGCVRAWLRTSAFEEMVS